MKNITWFIICFLFITKSTFSQVDSSLCNYKPSNYLSNLGLYGGPSLDITASNQSGRLFATANNPFSLYYSDDTCKNWVRAYPEDSLLYECGIKGWGGNTLKVLTNTKGWVAALSGTGDRVAALVSNENGDTNSWQAFMSKEILGSYGYSTEKPTDIALTDYYLFTSAYHYVVKQDSAQMDSAHVINLDLYSLGLDSSYTVVSVAAANSSSGYPLYLVIDTSKNSVNTFGELLIQIDSNNYTFVSKLLPSNTNNITSVFIPLNCKSGDTLFINTRDNTDKTKSYRSFNGGLTWQDITFKWNGNTNNSFAITDVDYSSNWAHKITLSAFGLGISYDLGTTWYSLDQPPGGMALLPIGDSILLRSYTAGIKISTDAHNGPFTIAQNNNFENINVAKVDYTSQKGVTYLATDAGIAYTTEIENGLINPIDRWKAPYGDFFPLTFYDQEGLTAIDINKLDTLNIVGGNQEGLYTTTTGPSGFTVTQYWSKNDGKVMDIEFIDATTVLVVTDGDADTNSTQGNIYRSTNKGQSWIKVTPSGFTCGNTIDFTQSTKGYSIYVGSGCKEFTDNGYVWKSTNMGSSWTKVNTGPTAFNDASQTKLSIIDIASYPGTSDTLLISAHRSSPSGDYYATVRTNNGGLTYEYIDLKDNYGKVQSIAINEKDTTITYYAIENKVIEKQQDSLSIVDQSWIGNQINHIKYGSIIIGTSIGFFGGGLNDADTIVTNIESSSVVKLKMYPVPASNTLKIEIPSLVNRDKLSLQVKDYIGREIYLPYRLDRNMIVLNTNELSSGLYIIHIFTADVFWEGKFIINK